MSANTLMQITQLPVIVEQLQTIKPIIEAKALELQAMECTDETLQAVKAMRAELRKDLADYEARRKGIKAAVTAPYEAFEAVYKECISGPLKAADEAAAAKIAEVEGELKTACEERLRALFDECRECYSIPWVRFEQVGIEITLALARQKTPKKAAVQIGEFFKAIRQDLAAIQQMDEAAEVAAEYVKTLSLAEAVSAVKNRQRATQEAENIVSTAEEQTQAESEVIRRVAAPAEPEETLTLTFTVTDTRDRLKTLKNWMLANGYHPE